MCNLVTWLVREQDILDDLCCLVVVAVVTGNTSVGRFLNCSSEVFCPSNEVGWVCSEGKVIPELWVCAPLTPESGILHCRDEFFILLVVGCGTAL